jgi:DNA polymerase-3 subunit gamma/tau
MRAPPVQPAPQAPTIDPMSDTPGHEPFPNGSAAGSAGADAAGQPGFDLGAEPSFLAPAAPAPYRVLARKYRPSTFDDLIGQEAMVRTISNAFSTNRIPQAWMLTGVRGVGKTTTARILARGLNYEPMDGSPGAPTIHMPELGRQCAAIMESRHVDVMEMDAASHTGVENIRQITDAVRYGPVQARYKVYIIDEVHMLSSAAFNAFLKTLEEPPPHAKFVFATTEIRKVPVTILSRCQRFDLRRIETGVLQAHLARICLAEGVEAEADALSTLARAAEGSVRDSLSLLDQAVAHGAGTVTAQAVREMLGLADRGQVVDLFEAVMRGNVPGSFAALRAGYDAGADPAQMMQDLTAFTHLVTRIKMVPDAARDPALTEVERVRGSAFAEGLTIRALSRAWQILIKALPEVGASQRPLAAAEMALVRLAYAADLPTPDEALRALRDDAGGARAAARAIPAPAPTGDASTAAAITAPAPVASAPTQPAMASLGRPDPGRGPSPGLATALAPALAPPPGNTQPVVLRRFEDVVALAGERRDISLKAALERDVRLVRFEDGHLEFALNEGGSRSLPNELTRALNDWTGRRWVVVLASRSDAPTLHEQAKARETERRSDAANHPLVRAVMATFPGAAIVDVRVKAAEVPAEIEAVAEAEFVPPPPDDDEPLDD